MNLADKISTLRLILVPLFLSSLIYSCFYSYLRFAAMGLFVLAALSDFFDGLAARIKKEKSEIGQIIDPLADKFLLVTSFVSLYFLRETLPFNFKMPLGVVLVVVSRDIIIVLGLLMLHFLKIEVIIVPTLAGKLTTFFQMFTVLSLLFNIFLFPWIWKIAAFFTLISGIDYFLRGAKAANAENNSSHC